MSFFMNMWDHCREIEKVINRGVKFALTSGERKDWEAIASRLRWLADEIDRRLK